MILDEIKERILEKEESLSHLATKSKNATRLREIKEDVRPAFFHDADKILHSTSFTRYIDKTQVFSFEDNDHVSKRMVHVQLVSKIARCIGRCLNLNEDLIEAAALGHDIGHTPLGHTGEKILNEISQRELGIPFMHNIQSVRNFMEIYDLNITIEVLDAIMCHNGEVLSNIYEPKKKTKEDFLKDYYESRKNSEYAKTITPMSLEGCVVRISDVIAYIGRDIEDAIRLGNLKREDIPEEIKNTLGSTNSEIVNTIILDIVENSYGKNAIIMSKKIYDLLNKLKDFNYQNIYNKANTEEQIEKYKTGMNKIYNKYLKDLEENNKDSIIYKVFLNELDEKYKKNNSNAQIVIDFIAGMTDDYFIKNCELSNK